MYISINPATEEVIEEFELTNEASLEKILDTMLNVQKTWREFSVAKKLSLVSNLREVIERRSEEIILTIVSEMGKTKAHAEAELKRLYGFCDHALERFEIIQSEYEVNYPACSSPAKVYLEPLGLIFSITPWNVPIGTLLRTSLPALLMGNCVVIKPAPNVSGCGRIFEELILEAGFPEGLCKVVRLSNEVAEKLIADFRVRKVSFVGSTSAGAHLASIAGKHIKPILLELGGSDPFIVLSDADIEQAAFDAAGARCNNAGQVCCASKRIIVESKVYNDFRELFVKEMSKKKCGDPMLASSDMGPLARKDIYDSLIRQVERSKASEVNVLLDGGPLEGKGYYFSPMVLEEKADRGFSTDEEFFGPVASLYKADRADHAVEIANLSRYGLGSAIYTKDFELALNLSHKLENGFVYINKTAGLNPYLPFGGVKDSGYGKDCGDEGYFEFVNKKVIV